MSSRKRFKTLSRTAQKRTVDGPGPHSQVLRASKQSERKLTQAHKRRAELQGSEPPFTQASHAHIPSTPIAYSHEDRDAIERMDIDTSNANEDVPAISHLPPPGEEAFDLSHEGGEFEAFTGLVEDIAQVTGQ
jgi:hypothetical protein